MQTIKQIVHDIAYHLPEQAAFFTKLCRTAWMDSCQRRGTPEY